MAWWYESAFAGAFHQCPALVGLEVVVGFAQRVALIDRGVTGMGVVIAVVDLAAGAVASLDGATRLSEQQRYGLGFGRPPPEVGDVADVDAAGDDQLQDRLAQQSRAADTAMGPRPGMSHTSPPSTVLVGGPRGRRG